MVTGILTWHNENGRSNYPLQDNNAVIDNVLVDACFVQFDNFTPILNSILVSSTSLTIVLTLDLLTLTAVYNKTSYTAGVRHLTLYDNATSKRYLGRLVFGEGANDLWNNSSNQLFTFNVPFVSTTVRSIPSADAVYSIDDVFGDIVISHASTDNALFYNANPAANWITFNAVQNSRFPDTPPAPVLKLINLVAPINNNIFIGYNDIIQLSSTGAGTLNISVVSTDFTPGSIISTLAN